MKPNMAGKKGMSMREGVMSALRGGRGPMTMRKKPVRAPGSVDLGKARGAAMKGMGNGSLRRAMPKSATMTFKKK